MSTPTITTTIKAIRQLINKLSRRSYRDAYVAEHVRRGIAYQIRALRNQRNITQGELAKLVGKPQSVVSRLEDPDYGKMNLQTLLELASAFDVALQVRFIDYNNFIASTRNVSPTALEVDSFSQSFVGVERQPISVIADSDDDGNEEAVEFEIGRQNEPRLGFDWIESADGARDVGQQF